MLNKKVEEALNAQINAEFWSAYLYLSMSAYFEAEGKSGFANWFKVQFKEEQAHAEIFMNFIQSRGGRVILKAIDEVPTSWESPLDVFKETLKHEQKVTSLIRAILHCRRSEGLCHKKHSHMVHRRASRRGKDCAGVYRHAQPYRRQRLWLIPT